MGEQVQSFHFLFCLTFPPQFLRQIPTALTYVNSYFYLALDCVTFTAGSQIDLRFPFSPDSQTLADCPHISVKQEILQFDIKAGVSPLNIFPSFISREPVFFPTILPGLTHPVSQWGALLQLYQLKIQMHFIHSNPHKFSNTRVLLMLLFFLLKRKLCLL